MEDESSSFHLLSLEVAFPPLPSFLLFIPIIEDDSAHVGEEVNSKPFNFYRGANCRHD